MHQLRLQTALLSLDFQVCSTVESDLRVLPLLTYHRGIEED